MLEIVPFIVGRCILGSRLELDLPSEVDRKSNKNWSS